MSAIFITTQSMIFAHSITLYDKKSNDFLSYKDCKGNPDSVSLRSTEYSQNEMP